MSRSRSRLQQLQNYRESLHIPALRRISQIDHRFPQPKIFSNAILQPHDITSLIRDTEPHERALYTLAPPDQLAGVPDANVPRRSTFHNTNGSSLNRSQRPGSTAATLLGGELGDQIRKETSREGKDRSEVDVNLLLKGAEKLCSAYPIVGAPERIASLRSRYELVNASINRYEARVSKQNVQLARLKKNDDDDNDEPEDTDEGPAEQAPLESHVTQEDIQHELDEIEELEKKKRMLEERVSGMERDLGGLLR